MRQHQIARHLEMIRDAACQLVGQMELVIRRRHPPLEGLGAAANVVEVRLEVPYPFRHSLILVDLDFELVLRPRGCCGESQDDHWYEQTQRGELYLEQFDLPKNHPLSHTKKPEDGEFPS